MVFLFSILFSVSGFTQDSKELLLNGSFESGVAKWKAYCDAAGITPVDGVGGGVAGFAISASTTSPLAGKSSGIITKDAANRQGCGVATDFTVQEENKAQVLQVKIPYKVTSGTYADDQYKVYVYDIDNASMIEVAPTFIKNSSIKEEFKGVFQASLTGVNYRLIIHNASTSAVASTLKIEAKVSSQVVSVGSFATDWQSYTNNCSGSWTTNTTYDCKMRMVGDSAELQVKVTLSGAPNAVQLSINSPLAIDAAKLLSNFAAVGNSTFQDSGVSSTMGGIQILSNIIYPYTASYPGSGVTTTVPFTWGAGDSLTIDVRVPIVGKTSNTVLSSEYSSRLAAFSGSGVTSGSVGSNTVVKFSSIIDKLGSYNGTTGEVEIKTPGYYKIFAAGLVSSGGGHVVNQYVNYILHIDGNLVRQFPVYVQNTGVQSWAGPVSWEGDLVAGQKIRFLVDTNITSPTLATGTSQVYLQIHNLSGSAVQVASEANCSVKAYHTSGASLGTAGSTIVFDSESYDYCGEYDPGTGVFIASRSGEYEIFYHLYSVNFTDVTFETQLFKNISTGLDRDDVGLKHPSLNRARSIMTLKTRLLAGENLRVKNTGAHTGQNLYTGDNWITIRRVGNY